MNNYDKSLGRSISALRRHRGLGRWGVTATIAMLAIGTVAARQAPPAAPQAQAPATQQPSEVELVISGEPGSPPHYAVPDFVSSTPDAADLGKTIGQVLWDDLYFEREVDVIPRDTYSTVPVARAPEQVPFAAWRELGADAVVFGSIQRTGRDVRVQVRLFNVRTRQSVFAKEYSGSDANVRAYAHTIADEIHLAQRALKGVARTKLAFSSDRNRERIVGTTQNRDVREIFMADYDGANQRRITTNRQLNIMPVWSPDARSIAYTSYRRGYPDIFIALIYQGLQEEPTKGGTQNWLPVFSPDGTKIVFTSSRDGNPEIVHSEPRRLRPAAYHQPSGDRYDTDLVADRYADRVHLRPGRHAADLHRRRRRHEPAAADDERVVCGPADVGAGTVQRDCLCRAQRCRVRHQGLRHRLRADPAAHLRRGHQREPGLLTERPAPRVHVDARRPGTGIHDRTSDGRNVKQITRDGNNYTPSWSN